MLEVLFTEFDKEKYEKAVKKEAWEDGFSEGLNKGQTEERHKIIKSVMEMYTEDGMDLESTIVKISKKFQLSIEEIRKIL